MQMRVTSDDVDFGCRGDVVVVSCPTVCQTYVSKKMEENCFLRQINRFEFYGRSDETTRVLQSQSAQSCKSSNMYDINRFVDGQN